MIKEKVRWLDRRIAAPGPYLALCLRESEFKEIMRRMHVTNHGPWIKTATAHATTHILHNHEDKLCCVVCLSLWQGRDPVEVAGLLVHEAVHVWQDYAASIGEHTPASEQEAYAVQAIAQELMAEFARRVGAR